MQVKFDYFNMPEDPQLFICNPNNHKLAPIVSFDSLVIKPTFNGISELSVNIYKYIENRQIGVPDELASCDCYKYIAIHRFIHVQQLGYFMITQSTENNDGINPYYTVNASSCEIELNNRKLRLDAGNYKFYDSQFPSTSIIGKVLELCPAWKLGNMPDSILNTYRSFSDTEENIYNFLSNDVEKAFGCIIDFDIENRVINVIDLNSEINSTSILLTHENVINNLEIKQATDGIATVLNVTGANNLGISDVNPFGTNYLMDFSYYKNTNWMSQGLIDSLNVWEKKVSDNQSNLDSILASIRQHKIEFENLNSDLLTLQSDLQSLEKQKSNLSSDGEDYSLIQTQLNNKNTEITNKNAEIVNKQSTVNNDYTQLKDIQTSLKVENNLAKEQYDELSNFMFENDYQNDSISVDDNNSYAQIQELQYALINQGRKKLKTICQPVTEFEMDCLNFVMIPEFDIFRDQFDLGKMIHVEINRGNIVDMMLLQYEIDWEEKTLKIKVSNQMKIHDKFTAYQEISQQTVKSSNTIAENKSTWDYPVKSGKIDDFETFRTSALNATLNKVISSTNEEISIDNTGIHGRAKYPSTGKLETEEMWLNKNNILFSDDNFQTAKTALGKITLSNGSVVYGLIADAIVAGTIDASVINVKNLNASNIVSGELDADLIKTGKIESQNGDYSLDMETGEVNMKRGTFSGDIKWTKSDSTDGGSIFYTPNGGLRIESSDITFDGNVEIPRGATLFVDSLNGVSLPNAISGSWTIQMADGTHHRFHFENGILTSVDGDS